MGVDTISGGTGKRDHRIGNPGLYRAYLGYAFPGAAGRGNRKVRGCFTWMILQ